MDGEDGVKGQGVRCVPALGPQVARSLTSCIWLLFELCQERICVEVTLCPQHPESLHDNTGFLWGGIGVFPLIAP